MNADLSLFLAREHIATLRAEADAARATHTAPTTDADPGRSASSRVVARIRSIGHRAATGHPITRHAA